MSDESRRALTPGPSSARRERGAAGKVRGTLVSTPRQARFLTIPQARLCYWLRERFFGLLAGHTLGDVADVCQGLATADDALLMCLTWKSLTHQRARPTRDRRRLPLRTVVSHGLFAPVGAGDTPQYLGEDQG